MERDADADALFHHTTDPESINSAVGDKELNDLNTDHGSARSRSMSLHIEWNRDDMFVFRPKRARDSRQRRADLRMDDLADGLLDTKVGLP
jgi:hypothetical protein